MIAPEEQARSDILNSRLSNTAQRNALALLDRAHPYNGHIKLSKASLMDLWGIGSPGTVRHYLTQLARAGIVHYSTNDYVYVDFKAWPPVSDLAENFTRGRVDLRVEGGDSTRGRVEVDPEEADGFTRGRVDLRVEGGDSTRGRVEVDPEEADGFTRGRVDFTRGRVDLRVEGGDSTRGRVEKNAYKDMSECVSSLTPIPDKNSLTHPISEDEQKLSAAILTDPDIGVNSRAVVAELIARRPFEEIRAFCCDLFAEGREPGSYAGLVVSRIRDAASVPRLYHNDLYQRHRTPAEIAEAQQAEAQQAEAEEARRRSLEVAAARPALASPPQAKTPADIWDDVLTELALSMPAPTFETWVRDTNVLDFADGEFVIGVPHAYARDWLGSRLAPQIKRILSRLCGRSVQVEFRVRERAINQQGANQ